MVKRLLGFCYLVAFFSIFIQFEGLLSYDGLLPIDLYINRVREHYLGPQYIFEPLSDIPNLLTRLIGHFPSLVVLGPELNLSPFIIFDFITILGIFASFLVSIGLCNNVLFFICWICYLSLLQGSQTWLYFQWDLLLLEAGFLAILTSPWPMSSYSSPTQRHCYQFLAWKLLFLSGVVKLQSKCPTWESLSSLFYHFATQCLPTSLAWFAHQLPPLVLKSSVALTLLLEIPWTFLLIMPNDYANNTGVVLQIIFQISIILTGNYTYFNVLTIYLLLEVSPRPSFNSSVLSSAVTWALIAYSSSFFIGIKSDIYHQLSSSSWWTGDCIYLKIKWNELSPLLPYCCAVGAIFPCLFALYTSMKHIYRKPHLFSTIRILINCIISILWILISSSQLDRISETSHFLPSTVSKWNTHLQPLRLVSSYGLFRSMTGVSNQMIKIGEQSYGAVARPELVIEGLHPDNGEWLEISFMHKPGSPYRRPSIVAPHQPRLDWHMWFAALASYQSHTWIVHLVYRLLTDDPASSSVLSLLSIHDYPFKTIKPKAVRILKYEYDFTRMNTSWARSMKVVSSENVSSLWWSRRLVGEYLPSLDLNDRSLLDFLSANGIDPKRAIGVVARSSEEGRNKFCQSHSGKPARIICQIAKILRNTLSNLYEELLIVLRHRN